MFLSLKVVDSKTRPPCIDGFVLSINALTSLFEFVRKIYGFKFLLTNRLNQDALENHFAVIRSRGGFRDNPDPYAFEAAFRQVLVQHLLHTPEGANCNDDLTAFMLNMQDVKANGSVSVDMSPQSEMPLLFDDQCVDASVINVDSLNQLCDSNVCEVNAVAYVSGYVAKVVLSSHACEVCRKTLLHTDGTSANPGCVFFGFKLYDGLKSTSLHTPSDFAVRMFTACRQIFVSQFSTVMCGNSVLHTLYQLCMTAVQGLLGSTVVSDTCMHEGISKAVALFLRILLYHKVKVLSRDMSSKSNTCAGNKKRNRKAMKVVHE